MIVKTKEFSTFLKASCRFDRHSDLQTNRSVPLEVSPRGGKPVVWLIWHSVWCMFRFISELMCPTENAPWYQTSDGRLMLMTLAAVGTCLVVILSVSVFFCRRARKIDQEQQGAHVRTRHALLTHYITSLFTDYCQPKSSSNGLCVPVVFRRGLCTPATVFP